MKEKVIRKVQKKARKKGERQKKKLKVMKMTPKRKTHGKNEYLMEVNLHSNLIN